MKTIDPKEIKTGVLHGYMLSAIAPRPIAFVSTIDKDGNPNLSPYSFFNAFGSNPPTVIFSPARRVRDNTIKHTLENVYETGEVVINVVNYDMVHQASLASCEYPKDVNEFTKAGFTAIPSEKVKPFRVKESPVQFECVVKQVIETGQSGGAGNLVICEIVLMHVHTEILDDDGKIDQHKIDLVGRCGHNFYSRATGAALFEIPKPNIHLGIGIDSLPEHIRNSEILSGNDLGQLGHVETLPSSEEMEEFQKIPQVVALINEISKHPETAETAKHLAAKELLRSHKAYDAWKVLLLKL